MLPSQEFVNLEASERLAVETAHRQIFALSQLELLSEEETRTLKVLADIVRNAKEMALSEYKVRRQLGLPDPEKAKELSARALPEGAKEP